MRALWPSLFALSACGRDAAVESTAEKRAKTAEPGKPTVPWSFDPSATLAKLEGSWVVQGFGSAGNVTAWNVERGKLTIYDPKTKQETPDELELSSPCKAHLKSGFGGTLVVDGDDIYLGLGDGGTRQGDTIAKLQGTWLVKGFGSYGAVSAWKFDGAKVTVYNPGKQTERRTC